MGQQPGSDYFEHQPGGSASYWRHGEYRWNQFCYGSDGDFRRRAPITATLVSSTALTATYPAGLTSPVNVIVTNPDGQVSNTFAWGNPAPTISNITPAAPLATGGTANIAGTNFVTGATVTFGAGAPITATLVSSTALTATYPAGLTSPVNVIVTNPDGQVSNTFAWGNGPVTVTSINPTSGPSGTTITIKGTGFTATSTVTVGGIAATSVICINNTQLTANVPVNTVGPSVDVLVTTGGQTSTPSTFDKFSYVNAPSVSSLSPNSGPTTAGHRGNHNRRGLFPDVRR